MSEMKDATTQGRCEVWLNPPSRDECGQPAVYRYAAMGGGWMRLCATHGAKHARYSERWDGTRWLPTGEAPRDAN